MTAEPTTQQPGISWPEGYGSGPLLRALRDSAMRPEYAGHPNVVAYRRAKTRADPLLFAFVYLRKHLRQQDTGQLSLSMFHVKLAERAKRWASPFGFRDIDVAPRGGAKSTWGFVLLPLWAAAHGHRDFFLGFSYTDDMGAVHLKTIKDELTDNALLLNDFPELALAPGSRSDLKTRGGPNRDPAWFAARTLQGTSLGLKRGPKRPDVIVGDDLEPMESDHSAELKAKIENKVVNAFLPMGAPNAIVQLFGTTTMHGGLMHEAARAARGEAIAPWIDAHEFDCHHWPALLDEGTPAERSSWPTRWTTEELQQKRDNPKSARYYALQYANDPDSAPAEGFWSSDMFLIGKPSLVQRRIIYMDPAMTANRNSDQTGIVMASLHADGKRVFIEHAEMSKLRGDGHLVRLQQLTAQAQSLVRPHFGPQVGAWWVEKNQGGDTWQERLANRPRGVELVLEHVSGHKRERINDALKVYEQGRVFHLRHFEQLEQQACTWRVWSRSDDLLDALAGALRALLGSTMPTTRA